MDESGAEEPQAQGVATGTLLAGRYRLIERIGAGGMAAVYVAEDSVLARKVAVKRLHADSPDHAARRFLREAKLGASLSHPNLVTVFDAFPHGSDLVIVMEYVAGPDLAETLEAGPLEEDRALSVLGDVAAALDHTHERGIVHRDVKPSNILLAPDGTARLTDLGVARVVEDTSTTQANLVVGSAPYMAPEQITGERAGPPADVYALALTAYEALSGERARTGIPAAISYQATVRPPPDIRDVREGTPPAVADALKRGLARDPAARPASAGAFVGELGEAIAASRSRGGVAMPRTGATRAPAASFPAPTEARSPVAPAGPRQPLPAPAEPRPRATRSREPRSRRRYALPLALALAVLAAGLVVVLSLTSGEDPPPRDVGATAARSNEAKKAESGRGGGGSGAAAGTPEAAVKGFYESAAADDFAAAEALATPNLEAQLGGVENTLGTLESIEFTNLETVSESAGSATVKLATVATHPDRTDVCSGTATLVESGGAWQVDQIGVDCR